MWCSSTVCCFVLWLSSPGDIKHVTAFIWQNYRIGAVVKPQVTNWISKRSKIFTAQSLKVQRRVLHILVQFEHFVLFCWVLCDKWSLQTDWAGRCGVRPPVHSDNNSSSCWPIDGNCSVIHKPGGVLPTSASAVFCWRAEQRLDAPGEWSLHRWCF